MPQNAQLTERPKSLPEGDTLDWEEKKLFIKQADVYGACLARQPKIVTPKHDVELSMGFGLSL